MWILTRLQAIPTLPDCYYLKCSGDFTVGRKDCIIQLRERSVSRLHATLRVERDPDNNNNNNGDGDNGASRLLVIDANSRFGTTCNKVAVAGGAMVALKDGDVLAFGTSDAMVFRVTHPPALRICGSGMSPAKKEELRQSLASSNLVDVVWEEQVRRSTHLVMPTAVLTSKLLLGLVLEQQIVAPSFVATLIESSSIDNVAAPLDENSHRPPLGDTLSGKAPALGPCAARRSLFQGMTFLFLCDPKQFIEFSEVIGFAGGRSILLTSENVAAVCSAPERRDELATFVALPHTNEAHRSIAVKHQELLGRITDLLPSISIVKVSAIWFAVLEASTEHYCTPQSTSRQHTPQQQQQQQQQQEEVEQEHHHRTLEVADRVRRGQVKERDRRHHHHNDDSKDRHGKLDTSATIDHHSSLPSSSSSKASLIDVEVAVESEVADDNSITTTAETMMDEQQRQQQQQQQQRQHDGQEDHHPVPSEARLGESDGTSDATTHEPAFLSALVGRKRQRETTEPVDHSESFTVATECLLTRPLAPQQVKKFRKVAPPRPPREAVLEGTSSALHAIDMVANERQPDGEYLAFLERARLEDELARQQEEEAERLFRGGDEGNGSQRAAVSKQRPARVAGSSSSRKAAAARM